MRHSISQNLSRLDTHHNLDRDPGGFYLTDSLVVAAQFVCYGDINEDERPKQVVVVGELHTV